MSSLIEFNLDNEAKAENTITMERGIAERDNMITDLETRIRSKQFMLIQRRNALETAKKQNHFLADVKKDYDKYYTKMLKQKTDQVDAIEYLTKYIDDIAAEESLSDDKIGETKRQQKDLLSELRVIKGHLDELVKYGEGDEN